MSGAETTAGTRPTLRVTVSTPRGGASAARPATTEQPSLNEILETSLEARTRVFEALNVDEDDPTIEQLTEFNSSGAMPSQGPLKESLAGQTERAKEKNGSVETLLSLSPSEQAKEIEASLEAALSNIEGPASSPITPEDAKRASKELATYVMTGALTEGALAKPSTLGRIGGPSAESDAGSATRLSEEIQHIAQDMLPNPSDATPGQRESAVILAMTPHLGIPNAEHMVASTRIIARHQRISEAGGIPDTPGMFRKLKGLRGGMSALTANEFKGPAATLAASITNVALRNTASVLLPTFARQMLSAQIEHKLAESGISDTGRAFLGGSFAALPMILLAAGAIRAHMNPKATQTDRQQGDYARGIMAAMSFGALLGGIFSGQLGSKTSGAAAQMIAFTMYTFMRDIVVQSHVRLKNSNMERRDPDAKPVPDKLHWALISLIYGLDQFAVNQLMPTAAPVSGPGAADSHLSSQSQAKAAAIRAGINLLGEIAEDLSFSGIAAIRDKKMLRLGLEWEPKLRHVANGLLSPMAVRTAITQTNVIFGDVIDKALGDSHPLLSNLLPAITMGGLLNGVFYWPFANAGKGLPQGEQPQVSETVLPNVDLSDSLSVRDLQRQSGEGHGIEMSTRNQDITPSHDRFTPRVQSDARD
ncbi:MAG: hypothetical protein QOI13_3185 [Paraburkholderia sp.]|nr:hypothetical protein [Paraburkholderia sp.]